MIPSLSGKIAVVTGGARGIGGACTDMLRASGAEVYVVDLGGDEPVDVTDRAALDALAGRIGDAHGRLDVLVNAAGIITANLPIEELPLDDFRRNFEVNVLGSLNTTQAFGGLLKAAPGAIVNVASQAALVSLPMQGAYTVSKGGVAALTRSTAIDWAADGVRANCVCPGFTITPMSAPFFENPTFAAAARQRIPLGRILEASEIAGAICFLVSPLASAITGAVIPVDGGWTAGEPALPW